MRQKRFGGQERRGGEITEESEGKTKRREIIDQTLLHLKGFMLCHETKSRVNMLNYKITA